MDAEELVRLLGHRGHRDSTPRRAVIELLCGWRGPFTAQEVADRLHDRGIGRATVFRTFTLLQQAGVLVRLHDGVDCTHYLLDAGTRHHVVCTGCGRVAPLELAGVGPAIERAARSVGFTIERHTLDAYGLCAGCGPASWPTGSSK
jgi:Fur family ferric uptake transcriptional regulator